ncbi:MAG: hypothetical protein IBX55_17680 [Methyloprofundus sp.]|nr:hypothetical protein [Methyloprofundus sp.]
MSLESLEMGEHDKQGRLFFNDNGLTDLSNIKIVGNFIDTVRQLYYGKPEPECLEHLGILCKTRSNITNEVLHGTWHVSHMGKAARYRFMIQNKDKGIVILYGSYFSSIDQEAQHLKFELSPHYIAANTPKQIQLELNVMADYFMIKAEPKGCAVHLACDVQGWDVPDDFIDRFTTYSRTIKEFKGFSSIDLSDFSNSAMKYGGPGAVQNYMIGKASSLQMCIYDKTQEIKISDKVDFMREQWDVYTLGTYDKLAPVKRIEARITHQIVREIGNGINEELESFEQVSDYLTDIWRYALTRNRLDQSTTTIDPFWQLIQEDCLFYCPDNGLYIKREKKTDVSAIGRNFTAILGNLISVMARNREMKAINVLKQLKKMSFFPDMMRYYESRQILEHELHELIERGLYLRRLTGKAA